MVRSSIAFVRIKFVKRSTHIKVPVTDRPSSKEHLIFSPRKFLTIFVALNSDLFSIMETRAVAQLTSMCSRFMLHFNDRARSEIGVIMRCTLASMGEGPLLAL